jgi:hypothetical protein
MSSVAGSYFDDADALLASLELEEKRFAQPLASPQRLFAQARKPA